MFRVAVITAALFSLLGCASDATEDVCPPDDPSCELEDFDGDGVANKYDDFPEDPACSEESISDCGACGVTCPANGECDAGVCACAPAFTGEGCDQCADPLKAGLDCDECADPSFTGANCDECASELKGGESCQQCIDERFTGDDCDICVDPLKTGPDCSACKDSSMAGEACDEPLEPDPEESLVNCLEYRACVLLECGETPVGDQQACADQAIAECGEPLDAYESQAADDLITCMLTECDSLAESSTNYECWRQKCLPEVVSCATPTFGESKCEHLGACFNVCGAQLDDTDWGCVRECLQTGTEKAVSSFLDLDYCLRAECHDAVDLQQCKQEVRLNTPLCQIPVIECVMND